jgi:DNA-binding XRE family transcriptional regulator
MPVTNLRLIRDGCAESQREAARKLGLSLATYSPIERGDLKPSPRIAATLEERFGLPVDVLLRQARVPSLRRASRVKVAL